MAEPLQFTTWVNQNNEAEKYGSGIASYRSYQAQKDYDAYITKFNTDQQNKATQAAATASQTAAATAATPNAQGQISVASKTPMAEPGSGVTNNLGIQTSEQQKYTRKSVMDNIDNPAAGIAEEAKQKYSDLSIDDIAGGSQFLDSADDSYKVGEQTAVTAAKGEVDRASMTPAEASRYDAFLASQDTPVANAAQGAVDKLVDPLTGTISEKAKMEAAQGQLPPEATMGGQMNELLKGLEGGEIPNWAKPAVEQVEAMLAKRGLSRSSIGEQAMFNAIIQAAAPIAQQDATLQARSFELNLNNRQQAAMQNATMYANMDQSNLTAAMQAQVTNAQNFLQLNMQNLSNEQQVNLVNQQSRLQTLMGDQAAENAAKQFNAANQTQVDVFMSQLGAQVSQHNSAQANAMSQYNTGQENAMRTFNSQVNFQREQFNAQMYAQIEQSNVQWRRQMNQIDTAGENAVNQANAINAFNLSNQALTLAWQDLRDSVSWAFQSGENDQERDVRLAIAALSSENDKAALSASTWASVGGWIAGLIK